jgi:uncharacterized secreted protein with C-terminal beta-propeller domain
MCRPSSWVVFSITFVFLFATREPREAGMPAEIEIPGMAEYPHPITQNLLLAVRTTEWQTADTGLLDVSVLAPPRPAGPLMIDDASLAEAMTDPQAFAYLPADTAAHYVIPVGGTTSASPSSR